MVINRYAGPKRVIQLHGAGHNSPLEDNAIGELQDALDWLWQMVPMARP